MSPPRPVVLLFDVDGTLIWADGAGRRALDRAFAALHGSDLACRELLLAGMTDRAIARAGLSRLGVEPSEAAIDALLERYLEFLEEELRAARNFRVLPGIEAALATASARPQVAVGLGTGNIRAGAERKLRHARLWHRFAFGGFADDGEERARLIRAGAERGAALLQAPLSRCRIVVIGDTPHDVTAARANGFEAIAVASGPVSLEALLESRPDYACASLEGCEALERLLPGAADDAPRARRWP